MAKWSNEATTNIYKRNRREILKRIWTTINEHSTLDPSRYVPGQHPTSLYGGKTPIPKPKLVTQPRNLPPNTRARVRYTAGDTP